MSVGITRIAESRSPGVAQAGLLLLCACLPIMGTVLLAPALPKVQAYFAADTNARVLVPLMLTSPALVLASLSLYAGTLIDRFGRRPLLLSSLLLYTGAGTAPLWLGGLYPIIGSRLLVGLAEAGLMTACTTLMGDYWNGARRERLLTLQTVVASLSAVVFFALGGALAENSWRTPFWLYSIGLVLVLPMSLALWEPDKPMPAQNQLSVAAVSFQLRNVVVICLITVVAAVSFYVIPIHLGFLLDAQGEHSATRIGQAIGVTSLATMLGAASYTWMARLGVVRHLAIAFAFMSAGFFLLVKAPTYDTVVLTACVNALGSGMVIPALLNWMMRSVGYEHRGRGSGAFNSSFFLGQFICPLVVLLFESMSGQGLPGALRILAWCAAIIALVGMLVPAAKVRLAATSAP